VGPPQNIIREPDGGLVEGSRAVNDRNGSVGSSADVRGKLGQPVEYRLRGWASKISYERSTPRPFGSSSAVTCRAMPTFPVNTGYGCFRTGKWQVRGGKV
jgi:hypothetical protein